MSSVTVFNCPQNTPDPARLRAVSSRPSNQRQKKPDGCTCWAGSVERRLDDCWPNAGAGGKQCQILVCSGRSISHDLSYVYQCHCDTIRRNISVGYCVQQNAEIRRPYHNLSQGDHFPDHMKFPEISSRGKQRLPAIECLLTWSTVIVSY